MTGAVAGVGRATVDSFALAGCKVALLSREPIRFDQAVADLRQRYGVPSASHPDSPAATVRTEAAADRVEAQPGPIEVWVNVAMATVLAPVSD